LAQKHLDVFEAGEFQRPDSDADMHRKLCLFGARLSDGTNGVASLACLFRPRPVMTEEEFEETLWARLQGLHDVDAEHGVAWAPGVGREPDSADFSFSVGGVAYFVVGLHPGASRRARRFCRPALVFNAHEQFERLRRDGRYDRMQSTIRRREVATHGSINPMLTDFGRGREAAQYSGRYVSQSWPCPLKVKT
jgi:FPC/CPF motif-containing protein YcgG